MGFVQVENKIYIFLHLFCIQWSPESVQRTMGRLYIIYNGVPAFWLAVFSMVWYNDDQQRSIQGGRVRELQELQRAKRASEAPWVKKIGNPSSWENLVMTSAYDRASERPYRLGGKGRGVSRYSSRSPIRKAKERHLSLAVFCFEKSEKTLISVCHVNKRLEWLI